MRIFNKNLEKVDEIPEFHILWTLVEASFVIFSCRNYRVKTTITYLPICLQRLPVESGGVILTRYPGQGGFSSFIINWAIKRRQWEKRDFVTNAGCSMWRKNFHRTLARNANPENYTKGFVTKGGDKVYLKLWSFVCWFHLFVCYP